jgi:hypothetical protein
VDLLEKGRMGGTYLSLMRLENCEELEVIKPLKIYSRCGGVPATCGRDFPRILRAICDTPPVSISLNV